MMELVVLTTAEMGDPGAGSSAGGQPAGAVVVPVEAAAAAAAPPAGAAGALVAPVAAVAAAAAAARAPPAATRLSERLALAALVFLLGCAGAGLAFFAMTLDPADFRLLAQGKACTPRTHAEVAGLRTTSEYLLLDASTQVLLAPALAVPGEAPTSAAVPKPATPASSFALPPATARAPAPVVAAGEAPSSLPLLEPHHPSFDPAPPLPHLGPPATRQPRFVPSAAAAAAVSSLCVLGLALSLALLLL